MNGLKLMGNGCQNVVLERLVLRKVLVIPLTIGVKNKNEMKKLGAILVVILSLGLGGALIYVTFYAGSQNDSEQKKDEDSRKQDNQNQTNNGNVSGDTDTKMSSEVNRVFERNIQYFITRKINTEGKNEEFVYFDSEKKQFYTSDLDGTDSKQIQTRGSEGEFESVVDVKFSPNGLEAIVQKKLENALQYTHIDFKTGTLTPLNEHIEHVVWSPDGGKIFYKYTESTKGEGALTVSEPTGKNYRVVKSLNLSNVMVDWLGDEKTLAYYLTPSGYRESSIYTMTTDGASVKRILGESYGLGAKWSPNGTKMIYTIKDRGGSGLQLYLADGNGENQVEVSGVKTLVEKCVWSISNTEIYCAIPAKITGGFVLPDDYYLERFHSEDAFVKINVKDVSVTQLFAKDAILQRSGELALSTVFDAHELHMSKDGLFLFFTTKENNGLWSVDLKSGSENRQ